MQPKSVICILYMLKNLTIERNSLVSQSIEFNWWADWRFDSHVLLFVIVVET